MCPLVCNQWQTVETVRTNQRSCRKLWRNNKATTHMQNNHSTSMLIWQALYSVTTSGNRNLKLRGENLSPRLENCQAMYDKEQQRLTKRKSVWLNAEAVDHDFQREFGSGNPRSKNKSVFSIVDRATLRTLHQKFTYQYGVISPPKFKFWFATLMLWIDDRFTIQYSTSVIQHSTFHGHCTWNGQAVFCHSSFNRSWRYPEQLGNDGNLEALVDKIR